MKELSIQEKAQKYNEALERAKGVIEQNPLMEYLKKGIEYILPELKENEDERIRKGIIRNLEYLMDRAEGFVKDELKERIAWLEKQVEQKPAFEMKTPEESLGIDSDTYNKIVDECIYGEQKPAWSEADETMWAEISELLWEGYKQSCSKFYWDDIRNWVNHKLKSLRHQNTWKPSEEQMNTLEYYMHTLICNEHKEVLFGLYADLKKLMEE